MSSGVPNESEPVSVPSPAEKAGTAATRSELLEAQLAYLAEVVRARLRARFPGGAASNGSRDGEGHGEPLPEEIPRPPPADTARALGACCPGDGISYEEHVVLLLALAPHLRPSFFDRLIADAIPQGGEFPEIGGVRGQQFRGFLPTGETAAFVLAGERLDRRFEVEQLFAEDGHFARRQILRLESPQPGEPRLSGRLGMDPEQVEQLTLGHVTPPRFGVEFPAQCIRTEMGWDELVLPETTLQQIGELHTWVRHHETLLEGLRMRRKVKRGYRVLFHGPPGTGKTLTATLLGKSTGRDVYRIDLSMVVSKFIGETEKNLALLFDRAQNKDWILFFDEADALFGKRTNVRDAHDRYANQEVAYLLQRVEDFSGLAVLASNLKSNIDDAFMRRFQASIHFPAPGASERLRLWRQAIPESMRYADDVRLEEVARRYKLAGAHIMNVAQYCCLQALDRGDGEVRAFDLETGILREIGKDGKLP